MPRGLGWSFQEWKTYWKVFTNHFYDTILLWAHSIWSWWQRGFAVLEKIIVIFPDMSSKKSYSNIPHNRKVVQHLLFNKDFAHSVIYTLTLIESYLNIVLKKTTMKQ
jgi:hypothetical protein